MSTAFPFLLWSSSFSFLLLYFIPILNGSFRCSWFTFLSFSVHITIGSSKEHELELSQSGFQTHHLWCCCSSVTSFLSVLEKSWNHSFWNLAQTSHSFSIFLLCLFWIYMYFSIAPCSICLQAARFLQNWRIKKVHPGKPLLSYSFFLH